MGFPVPEGVFFYCAAYRRKRAALNSIQLLSLQRMSTLAPGMDSKEEFQHALQLSPLRHSSAATTLPELVIEQLRHFGVDPDSEGGRALGRLVRQLGAANCAAHELWELTVRTLGSLDRQDRIAWYNAKRFACFQLAKVLDTLQNPLRSTYQALIDDMSTAGAKGPNPLFDNVTALFSATPVITRTATYVYACTEWIEDAFKGRELLHEIYSRLLNPPRSASPITSRTEAGPKAGAYFAWNFNSGMAAIDTTLAHLIGARDIVLSSRNVYGGTYQLLHDWYGKKANLDVALEWFDGESVAEFAVQLEAVTARHADRLAAGRQIFIYLESPCNPHGYVLDVPGICRLAHARGLTVICDATIGTPFLQPTLRRADPSERPDFVIHSYTKDLCGSGNTTAGVVIARGERMFLPKGETVRGRGHDGRERDVLECVLREGRVPGLRQGLRGPQRHAHRGAPAPDQVHQHHRPGARARAPSAGQCALRRTSRSSQCAAVCAADDAGPARAPVHDRFRAPGGHRVAPADEAAIRQPRAGLRAAGEPRAGEHGRAVPSAHQPFGDVGRCPAPGGHRAEHRAHQRWG
jgi:hypothetical protein